MAIFFDAPVEPDDLTTFVREVPVPPELTLSNLFPRRDVSDNKVNFMEIVHTNRTAKFRSYDGRISVSSRDTGSEKFVNLPPLSSSLNMGEYERLQLEFARTGGSRIEALANAIYNDAQHLTQEVLNRMEMAWGDVLTDGKLSINENGLVSEADFGVPAAHIVAPLGALWSNTAASVPLSDSILWSDQYLTTNGFKAGQIRTSQRIMRLVTRNTEIINAIKGAAATVSRVTIQEVNDLFDSEGLPTFGPPIDSSFDVDGVTTRTIADDKVLFLPPNIADLGYTAYGLTATALELVNSNEAELSFEQAPGIVGVVEKVGPPYRQFTFVDAVGMPILVNAKRLLVADVA